MPEFKFDIVKEIGVISENSNGWKKEFNIVSFSGHRAKYDLREWSEDHQQMKKGITLTEEELRALKDLIDSEIAELDKED